MRSLFLEIKSFVYLLFFPIILLFSSCDGQSSEGDLIRVESNSITLQLSKANSTFAVVDNLGKEILPAHAISGILFTDKDISPSSAQVESYELSGNELRGKLRNSEGLAANFPNGIRSRSATYRNLGSARRFRIGDGNSYSEHVASLWLRRSWRI